MNCRLALFFALIVLATGSVLGQEEQLTSMSNYLPLIKQTFTAIMYGNYDDSMSSLWQLEMYITEFALQISELPSDSGTYLNNHNNQVKLENVVDEIDLTNTRALESLKAWMEKQVPYTQNVNPINNLLLNINQMVADVTAFFQEKLSDWTGTSNSNLIRQRLVEHRRKILNLLAYINENVCKVKKSSSIILNDESRANAQAVLDSIRSAAQKVTVFSCKGLSSCITKLVPIAERLIVSPCVPEELTV